MMARASQPAGDPRQAVPVADPRDVRPLVAGRPRGGSTLLIAGGMGIAGVALFLLLDSNRRATEVPAVRATAADRAAARSEPPPLYLPPAPAAAPVVLAPVAAEPVQTVPAPAGPPRIVYVPQPQPLPQMMPAPVQQSYTPPAPARGNSDAALVIDTTVADGSGDATGTATGPGAAPGTNGNGPANAFATLNSATTAAPGARARAAMLGGRATSVLQGTLLPAVLETALDSNRPGLARALISRDVRSFDGSRVLIPRGSRLTGEYRSDVAQGQNRALIVWTRLVRPDGAAIALGSPVADTLGRTGVRARVDSHFFTRFAGAILQSVLAVGVNLASRPNNDTLVVGLPGATLGGIGGGG
ncbi:TrbI/VirB10 family protein, partial [Sphingomonas sp. Leaf33]|uniref:TrbI/VirB10 family protein n=1 Tax=Sphingomonas sp. Leaf33 TaxID=1736215 RepID=UPI001F367E74